MTGTVHVAVGIVADSAGAILIARRPDHAHQGGLWEFPGGKVEAAESVATALQRELHEELGIAVQAAEPWLQIRHAYPDKTVLLDVWRVTAWRGEPHGREGQPLRVGVARAADRFRLSRRRRTDHRAVAPGARSNRAAG